MADHQDLANALTRVLKAAFCEDNLARGINESCRAIEATYENKGKAVLCLLAENCEDPNYKKLITALCKTENVPLNTIDERKKLGIYAGFCRIDKDGNAKKVRGCSAIVIKRWPKSEEGAINIIKQHFNIKN